MKRGWVNTTEEWKEDNDYYDNETQWTLHKDKKKAPDAILVHQPNGDTWEKFEAPALIYSTYSEEESLRLMKEVQSLGSTNSTTLYRCKEEKDHVGAAHHLYNRDNNFLFYVNSSEDNDWYATEYWVNITGKKRTDED